MNHARHLLLPIAAALTLLASSAGAVTVNAGASSAAQQSPAEQSVRKQLERQRKLQARCARLAGLKTHNLRQSERYGRLCGAPAASTPPAGDGPAAVGGDDEGYLDEMLDLPPIFTPPFGDGTPAEDDAVNVPVTLPLPGALPPATDVPEPGSLALLGLGLVGLGMMRRRRR